jgi:integrase/recombinase XerC
MREERIVQDKTYQRLPIGGEVKRWLEALRWIDRKTHTLEAYEIVGARLALEFPDYPGLREFTGASGVEDLRYFLDKHWRDAAANTRRARTSALRSLFDWAVNDGLIAEHENPAAKIRAPKWQKPERRAHPQSAVLDLVFSQDSMRDRICLQLLGRLGLRRNEIRLLQQRDINLSTNEIRVRGKGGKVRVLPIGSLHSLRRELDFYLRFEVQGQPTDYLLFPKKDTRRPMTPAAVHRWFKRCLEEADLPDMPMHELRHTAADHLYRATNDLTAVQLLLGHESVGTTQAYLHPTLEDLDRKLSVVEAGWAEAVSERTLEGLRYA